MQEAARELDDFFNPGAANGQPRITGFILLAYTVGEIEAEKINYVGNGTREDAIQAIKEISRRWDVPDTSGMTMQ